MIRVVAHYFPTSSIEHWPVIIVNRRDMAVLHLDENLFRWLLRFLITFDVVRVHCRDLLAAGLSEYLVIDALIADISA